jgi:hypothetical protein
MNFGRDCNFQKQKFLSVGFSTHTQKEKKCVPHNLYIFHVLKIPLEKKVLVVCG